MHRYVNKCNSKNNKKTVQNRGRLDIIHEREAIFMKIFNITELVVSEKIFTLLARA